MRARYIDFHTHILFDVDHGVKTCEEYERLLDAYLAAGITEIVLTPHIDNPSVTTKKSNIDVNFETAKKIAADKGMKVLLGCEYYLDSQLNPEIPAINGLYVLCEFPVDHKPYGLEGKLEKLSDKGYEVVIAHIERYRWLRPGSPEVEFFRNMGAWIQMNAASAGKFKSRRYLKKGLIDIIASDNHGNEKMPALLRKCLDDNPEVLQRMQNLDL